MRSRRPFMHAQQDKFLDGLMALMIIFLLISFAFDESGIISRKAEMTNVFSVFSTARTDLSEYFAMHGTWPDHLSVKDNRTEKLPDIDVQDGAFTIDVQSRRLHDSEAKTLSLRPATLAGGDAAVVLWVCGNHPVPMGMQASGKNFTSLQMKELYALCR